MSMSDLLSGADCGPSNGLQQLGKRLGQDRSTQLDRYGNAAGPSSGAGMRTARMGMNGTKAQSMMQQPQQQGGPGSFDLSSLGEHLPPRGFGSGFVPSPMQNSSAFNAAFGASQPRAGSPALAAPAWASDFLATGNAPGGSGGQKFMQARQVMSDQHQQQQHFQQQQGSAPRMAPSHFHGPMMGGPSAYELQSHQDAYSFLQQQPSFAPAHAQPAFQQVSSDGSGRMKESAGATNDSQWAKAFTAFEQQATSQQGQSQAESQRSNRDVAADHLGSLLQQTNQEQVLQPQHDQRPVPPADADELARAAGKLVETIAHEQSTKFKQSNFLELMRRLRDRQAGILGQDIVDTPEGAAALAAAESQAAADKGKGKAVDQPMDQTSSMRERFGRPDSQLNATPWAHPSQMGRTSSHMEQRGDVNTASSKQMPVTPGFTSYEQETEGRAEMADLWAEEDARSEALEQAKLRESQDRLMKEEQKARMTFVGDGGDVAEREREDLFAALTAEDEERERQRRIQTVLQQQGGDDDADAMEFARFQNLHTNVAGAGVKAAWQEDVMADEKMSDRADSPSQEDFVGRRWENNGKGRGVHGAQAAEWAKLQEDWDAWDVASNGMQANPQTARRRGTTANLRAAPAYVFQQSNPYLETTRRHAQHAAATVMPEAFESLLESEARAQTEPHDAGRWLELGVRQQENEREGQAIAALRKAVDLDPSLRDAWLALAVSYTNENDRSQAFEAIEQWIQTSDAYADVVRQHRGDGHVNTAGMSAAQRHNVLTDTLIALARHGSAEGQVDADVQIALGVLFNASEEYDKAVDCFASALSVRPDDWLLYNRLGATLSNSGRSNEAISYYHHALELQPSFVRCHFNLSISCLNLKVSDIPALTLLLGRMLTI